MPRSRSLKDITTNPATSNWDITPGPGPGIVPSYEGGLFEVGWRGNDPSKFPGRRWYHDEPRKRRTKRGLGYRNHPVVSSEQQEEMTELLFEADQLRRMQKMNRRLGYQPYDMD
jgi:hypothetical protein